MQSHLPQFDVLSPSRRLLQAAGACALGLALTAPTANAQGYVAAEGGGSINSGVWADQVFGWMLDKGGFGDVVVLGVSGADNAAAAKFNSLGAASVTNLAVNAGNANSAAVYNTLAQAEVIWMRGGDQWKYVNFWNGTLTEQAIREVFDGGGVVGGTSAGCAILGEVIYDARNGTVYPYEALQNPFIQFVTLTNDFLELTPGVVFDTHFTERGRLGRLPIFMGRAFDVWNMDLQGIGVDDRTALCVSPDGTAEVIGEGAVTVLHRTAETQQLLQPGEAPFMTHLAHTQMTEGYVWDLNLKQVITRPSTAVVPAPPVADPTFASGTINGNNLSQASLGDWQVVDGGNDAALFNGALQILDGQNLLQETIVTTRSYDLSFDENRVGGMQYAMALHPHLLGLMLHGGGGLQTFDGQLLAARALSPAPTSVAILDSHGVASLDFAKYPASGSSAGPRQSVALEGIALHILAPDMVYDAQAHAPSFTFPFGQGSAGCFGLHELAGQGLPTLGNATFSARATGAGPFGVGLLAIAESQLLDGQDLLGLGFLQHVDPLSPGLSTSLVFADDQGESQIPLPLPNDPQLAGITAYTQVIWPWPVGPCQPGTAGLSSSNGLGVTLLP